MADRPKFGSEERALLDAIHDEPLDQMRYLIYADWLEERGDPLAQHIRASIGLASLPISDPARQVAVAQISAMQAQHRDTWKRPISRGFRLVGWYRGMPVARSDTLLGGQYRFLERADSWIRHISPRLFIQHWLHGDRNASDSIIAHPFMGRIHFLRLLGGCSDGLTRELAARPARLVSLTIVISSVADLSDDNWGMLSAAFGERVSYQFRPQVRFDQHRLLWDRNDFRQPPSSLPEELRAITSN